MLTYWARSKNGNGEKETVKHHLELTSALAGEYAERFGQKQNGQCIGLFHDMGKYTENFQEVLCGEKTGVNHAVVGAYELLKYNLTLARVIYAHHSDLKYNVKEEILESSRGKEKRDRAGKLYAACGKKEYIDCEKQMQKECAIIGPENVKWEKSENKFKENLEKMLYMRMMLSCLVDADYTASASHFDEHCLEKCVDHQINARKDLEALERYKRELAENSTADSKINAVRDKLYADCLLAAEHKPGMFTLTAPTGSGKTLALLAFALKHAQLYDKKRIIIVLPFLSIIEQNAAVYRKICNDVLEQHSATKFPDDDDSREDNELLRIYTERWSAEVIITTSVNFFEGLYKNHAADCRRLHNIAQSVIVFDEAQSIPVSLIDTTINTLDCLCGRYQCSVVLSTATQPAFGYRKNLDWNPHEIIQDQKTLFKSMSRIDVNWEIDKPQPLEEIALRMSRSSSCCTIVNLKAHCAKLYHALTELCGQESVFAISTNMCMAHRSDVLDKINERLKNGLPCRIVSTQCIEAGVDLDVQEMYRALAPLEAIVQSAGRCNRNGKAEKGIVTVFIPDEDKLYPDDDYDIAACKVKTLWDRYHTKHIDQFDIENPQIMDEYYHMLFTDQKKDAEKLIRAIEDIDFDGAKKHYRFIRNEGVNIIVPYPEKLELFREITQEIRQDGITPALMKKARQITVSTYDVETVKNLCEAVFFRTNSRGRTGNIGTNWYILCEEDRYTEQGILIKHEVENNLPNLVV